MAKNPFGDEDDIQSTKEHPFGETGEVGVAGAAARIEHAARKIRGLRRQLGSEGFTLAATRELVDELTASLDAAARALRELSR